MARKVVTAGHFSIGFFSALLSSSALFAAGYNNANQWKQIGWASSYSVSINNTPQTLAPTGKGITVGVLDTGATPAWVGNPSGSVVLGTCQLAGCTSSADNNGHGTFVASEIVSNLPSIGMTGLANGAKVLAVKVLDANGSGNSAGLSSGIIAAANSGAHILNLSLGPTGTAAQQAAFYSSIASAVNYAASKGVVVVFAGGNSSQALSGGANITGFSDAALQRMLFVGSVNASNTLSSFSNTPGSAGFVSSSNKFYAYNSMWVMADGENLFGASNYYTPQAGYGYLTQMSGTSMAAPQGAAALALLESQWSILRTNGTATQLLEVTAKDLGTKGTDTTYGTGLINLTQAMQPYGTMTVMQANGKSVPLSSITGQVILGGAFGAVSGGKLSTSLQRALTNYATFDGFGRNYVVNLSQLVTGTASSSTPSSSVTSPKTTSSAVKFTDGSSLAFGNMESESYSLARPAGAASSENWYASFTNVDGSSVAAGSGFPAAASFAGALWGNDNPAAGQIYALGASSTLSTIAQGGAFVAYGTPVTKTTNMAFSWSQTKADDAFYGSSAGAPSAHAFNAGITHRLTEHLTGGLTLGTMDQQSGLLDTTYSGTALNLGSNHTSFSMGASATYALSAKQDLVFDAALVRTNGASVSDSLITSVTPMYARSMGAAFVQRDAVKAGDNVNLSLRAPLRVVSGSVSMLTTGVDENGLPVTNAEKISMKPGGNELDLTVGYQAPVSDEGFSWNLSAEARRDAGNVSGENDVSFLLGGKLSF